jgi:hypothetical protein
MAGSSGLEKESKSSQKGMNPVPKDDPVREYYLSLVKEEYNRLNIVELHESLVATIGQKLDKFLW